MKTTRIALLHRLALGASLMTAALGIASCSSNASVDASADGDAAQGVATDAEAAAPCDGACLTLLSADLAGTTRTLDRAQFGIEAGDAGQFLHVEAHAGGDPACPTQQSLTPDRTLILTGIPRGALGKTLTEKDGVRVSLLDFKGDQVQAPLIKATSSRATISMEDPATPPGFVAIDLVATFAEGTVKGRIYAAYCASLSL